MKNIRIVDSHSAGEPTRVVIHRRNTPNIEPIALLIGQLAGKEIRKDNGQHAPYQR